MNRFPAAILAVALTSSAAFALQPGAYNTRDWNAGIFCEPGGGEESAEGLRTVSYNPDPGISPAREMLKKDAAWEYIGDLQERLFSGVYTGEILLRAKPDPKYNTLSDGIIFNTGGGRNYYARRKDGEHIIIIDAAGGRQEIAVTPETFFKFENSIHDDNDVPYVFFDREGNEAAILFAEWHTRVRQKFNETGEVIILLNGARPARHRYR